MIPEQALVDLATLQAHPDNYRVHPPAQRKRLMKSLLLYGQQKPLPVRKVPDGLRIVAGHGVVEALRELSETDHARFGRVWVSYTPDAWDDQQALGYLVADNETTGGVTVDYAQLADIATSFSDMTVLGMSEKDMAALRLLIDPPQAPVKVASAPTKHYLVLTYSPGDWEALATLYGLPDGTRDYQMDGKTFENQLGMLRGKIKKPNNGNFAK